MSYSEEENTVIKVVEQFFSGLAEKDTMTLRAVMLPLGTVSSIREADGQVVVHSHTHEDFFQSIAVYSVVKTGCEESPLGPPEFPEIHKD